MGDCCCCCCRVWYWFHVPLVQDWKSRPVNLQIFICFKRNFMFVFYECFAYLCVYVFHWVVLQAANFSSLKSSVLFYIISGGWNHTGTSEYCFCCPITNTLTSWSRSAESTVGLCGAVRIFSAGIMMYFWSSVIVMNYFVRHIFLKIIFLLIEWWRLRMSNATEEWVSVLILNLITAVLFHQMNKSAG